MIINELPSVLSPQSGDEIPIERGEDTYKIDYDALATAILNKIGAANLTASPSMRVNLESIEADDVMKAAPAPGVAGILPITNGGTGIDVAPSMLVNLETSTAANVMQASPRPGVTGTLRVLNGGTGADNKADARNILGTAFCSDILEDTWGELWTNYLSKLTEDTSGIFWLENDAASVLSDGQITGSTVAIIAASGYNGIMRFRITAMSNHSDVYTWTVSNATENSYTVGTIYKCVGTPDGIMPIENGGTGGATAAAARTNLSMYSKAETDSAISQSTADKAHRIFFNVATWADVYSKLSVLAAGETAPMFISTTTVSLMTGGAVPSGGLIGSVGMANPTTGRYTFFATHAGGDFSCMWEINGLTSASATPTILNFHKIESTDIVNKTDDVTFNETYVDTSKTTELNVRTRGNVCTVFVTFAAKTDIGAGGIIVATGLPKPPMGHQFVALEGISADGYKPVVFRVDTNGQLRTGYMGSTIAAGHTVRLGCTYVLA